MLYPVGQLDAQLVEPVDVVYVLPLHTAHALDALLPVLPFAVPAPHAVRPPVVVRSLPP